MLDELYSETILITKKLRVFLGEIPLKDKNYLNQVDYFEFDPEFNKREELFMLDMRNLDKDTPRIRAQHTEGDDFSAKDVELKSRSNKPLGVKDINAPQIIVKAAGSKNASSSSKKKTTQKYNLLSPEASNDENSALRMGFKSPSGDSLSSEDLLNNENSSEVNIQGSILPKEDYDLLSSNLLTVDDKTK